MIAVNITSTRPNKNEIRCKIGTVFIIFVSLLNCTFASSDTSASLNNVLI